MNARSVGIAQLLFAATAWGTSFSVTKTALLAVDPFHATAIRYGFAAVVFLAILVRFEGLRALRMDGRSKPVLALGMVGIVGGVLLMIVGLDRTRAEHAAVVVATQPLMAASVAWVLQRQRPARHTLIAIVLAFTGVVLVVSRGDPRSLAGSGTAVGDLLVFVSALCWVTYTLGARGFPAWSPLRYTALTASAGSAGVVACTLAAIASGFITVPSAAAFASVGWELFYMTAVAAMLATLSWNSGIRRVGPEGVLFINFVPVTAFAIGIVQGYAFNWAEILGAVLVIGALLANHLFAPGRPKIVV